MQLKVTYDANSRRESNPAELPPDCRVVSDHLVDAVVEAVYSIRPGYRDTFEEDQEKEAESGHGVGVENLEHVHATLETSKMIID